MLLSRNSKLYATGTSTNMKAQLLLFEVLLFQYDYCLSGTVILA